MVAFWPEFGTGMKGRLREGGTSQPRTLVGGNSATTWIEYPVAALLEAREKAPHASGSQVAWWSQSKKYIRINFRGIDGQSPGGFGIPRSAFLPWAQCLREIGSQYQLWEYEPQGRFHYYDDSAESRLVRFEDGTFGYFFWFENSQGWNAFVNVIMSKQIFDIFLAQVNAFLNDNIADLLFDRRRLQ